MLKHGGQSQNLYAPLSPAWADQLWNSAAKVTGLVLIFVVCHVALNSIEHNVTWQPLSNQDSDPALAISLRGPPSRVPSEEPQLVAQPEPEEATPIAQPEPEEATPIAQPEVEPTTTTSPQPADTCVPGKLYSPEEWPPFNSDPYPMSDEVVTSALDKHTCLKDALLLADEVYHRNIARRRAIADDDFLESPNRTDEQMIQWFLEPVTSCPVTERIGNWGDGGKIVCIMDALVPTGTYDPSEGKAVERTVISIGSNGDTSFEDDIFRTMAVQPSTFDPYVDDWRLKAVCEDPNLHYFKAGLTSAANAVGAQTGTLPLINITQVLTLAKSFYAHIFKIDCEGCELDVFPDLAKFARDRQPLGQIQVEIHGFEGPTYGRILKILDTLGYRLFHSELNFVFPGGYELAFVHENAITHPEWRNKEKGDTGGSSAGHSLSEDCLKELGKVSEAAFKRSVARSGAMRWEGRNTYNAQKGFLWINLFTCLVKERFGSWDEGGAWVCRTSLRKSATQEPVHITIGAPQDVSGRGTTQFEADLVAHMGGNSYVFNPDLPRAVGAPGDEKVTTYPIQVQGTDPLGVGPRKSPDDLSIDQALEKVKAQAVDVLRLDCEGCEYGIVKDMKRLYARDSVPFGQIAVQLHLGEQHPELTAGLMEDLESLGYALFWAKENAYARDSRMEASFIHESTLA